MHCKTVKTPHLNTFEILKTILSTTYNQTKYMYFSQMIGKKTENRLKAKWAKNIINTVMKIDRFFFFFCVKNTISSREHNLFLSRKTQFFRKDNFFCKKKLFFPQDPTFYFVGMLQCQKEDEKMFSLLINVR